MSLLFFEGFESMSTATRPQWYSSGTINTSLPDGRSGSGVSVSSNALFSVDLGAGYSEVYVGFAVLRAHTNGTATPFFNNTQGTTQATVLFDATNLFYAAPSTGGTPYTGGLSAHTFPPNKWHYVEIYVLISATVGVFTVKVNGVTEISLTNIDTYVSGNVDIRTIHFQGAGISSTHYDDIYVCSTAGAAPWNGFLGENRVTRLAPDGAGATTTWTPSAGSNYQNVDESPDDGDTTYNSHNTIGDIDLYTYGALPTTATTINGVRTAVVAKKTAAAARIIRPVVRTASTNYEGSDFGLSTSYLGRADYWQANPNTSSAWTPTEVNGVEAGAKVQA